MKIEWTKSEDTVSSFSIFPEGDFSKYSDFSSVELFELFFDDELIQCIVEQSIVYCLSKNWPVLKVKCEEIKVFVAILIVSGYNLLPSTVKPFIGQQGVICVIQQCMRGDRINTMMKCLHFQ